MCALFPAFDTIPESAQLIVVLCAGSPPEQGAIGGCLVRVVRTCRCAVWCVAQRLLLLLLLLLCRFQT